MLEALTLAGYLQPIHPGASSGRPEHAVEVLLESPRLYWLALQVGQQSAAWFTSKEELIRAMRAAAP